MFSVWSLDLSEGAICPLTTGVVLIHGAIVMKQKTVLVGCSRRTAFHRDMTMKLRTDRFPIQNEDNYDLWKGSIP